MKTDRTRPCRANSLCSAECQRRESAPIVSAECQRRVPRAPIVSAECRERRLSAPIVSAECRERRLSAPSVREPVYNNNINNNRYATLILCRIVSAYGMMLIVKKTSCICLCVCISISIGICICITYSILVVK